MSENYKPFTYDDTTGTINVPNYQPLDAGIQMPLASQMCNCCCGGSEGSGDIYTVVNQLVTERQTFMDQINSDLANFKTQMQNTLNQVTSTLDSRLGAGTVYYPFSWVWTAPANTNPTNIITAAALAQKMGIPNTKLTGANTVLLVTNGERGTTDQYFSASYQSDSNVAGGGFWVLYESKTLSVPTMIRVSGIAIYNTTQGSPAV